MLPKKYRIVYRDFAKDPSFSQKFSSSLFDLYYKKSKEGDLGFVFVAGKKLDKRSTRRNTTKRLMTETVWKLLPNTKTSGRIMVRAKKIISKKDWDILKKEMGDVFAKAQL
jgi:ribonuclease P protein component